MPRPSRSIRATEPGPLEETGCSAWQTRLPQQPVLGVDPTGEFGQGWALVRSAPGRLGTPLRSAKGDATAARRMGRAAGGRAHLKPRAQVEEPGALHCGTLGRIEVVARSRDGVRIDA